MADKNEYDSAWTRSKACLETKKAIMSKAHEEGGDVTSLERLASAFLLVGIAETSDDEIDQIILRIRETSDDKIERIIESTTAECVNRASCSLTRPHYKVHKQENGRKPCVRNGRHWLRITHLISWQKVIPSIHQ